MRKEIFRMPRAEAEALVARAPVVRIATTNAADEPVLRTVHGVVVRGGVAWHGAPAGEKMETVGREAVVAAEEVVATVPSYFLDPERACPATTLYRSVEIHGAVEQVDDPAHKAEVLQALMEKLQPEGGHVPITADHPLYAKAVEGILVLRVGMKRLDGKAKLAQNRSPQERARLLAKLWERGLDGDPAAVEAIRAANPDTPAPAFLAMPDGLSLACALGPSDAEAAAELLVDAYWNGGMTREDLVRAHLGSSAWVGARDASGKLVATARAISDRGKRAWIYDVMVAPALRGQGVGERVVRLLLDHPAVRGVRRAYLGTRDAQGFYARLGFGDRHELETRQRPFTTTEMVLLR
jgi:nitroimidazol reductase NimA-like FMN-containing flavoprotein (pyridoxamine 5'-phosphate oxidase superfamily)/N-acetylglutamate synthase-like GNAT family acetyltransferase